MTLKPSWMWGSSSALTLRGGTTFAERFSAQLAQVSLPEPAVCSLYLQAEIQSQSTPLLNVGAFTISLSEGVGRVTVPRNLTFLGQPAGGSPLELTIPFVPVHALQVQVFATLGGIIDPGDELVIQTYFVLSPLTRIPDEVQPLTFGMSEPGEADSLDDDMLDELEQETPTVQEILTAGEPSEPEPEPEVIIERTPRSALIEQTIAELEQRLGRRPSKPELVAALARIDARRARRGFGARAPGGPPAGPPSPDRRAFVEQVIGILRQQLGRAPSKAEVRAALGSFEVPS